MLNPFVAVITGTAIGFALLVPFGGLPAQRAASKQPPTHEVRCDLMGCVVTRIAKP